MKSEAVLGKEGVGCHLKCWDVIYGEGCNFLCGMSLMVWDVIYGVWMSFMMWDVI